MDQSLLKSANTPQGLQQLLQDSVPVRVYLLVDVDPYNLLFERTKPMTKPASAFTEDKRTAGRPDANTERLHWAYLGQDGGMVYLLLQVAYYPIGKREPGPQELYRFQTKLKWSEWKLVVVPSAAITFSV